MSEGEGKKEVCRHNQTGFCKYGERCRKQHVNIKCNQDECKDKKCSRRHPHLCKFYAHTGFCKFQERCAFVHKEINVETHKVAHEVQKIKEEIERLKSNVIGTLNHIDSESVIKDMKNLKAEVDFLKNIIKPIVSIRQEGKVLKKSVDKLREEI